MDVLPSRRPGMTGRAWRIPLYATNGLCSCPGTAHDPEKWVPVFGKDHAPTNELEQDDDSKRSHPALRSATVVNDVSQEIPVREASLRNRMAMYGANRLQIGLFG